MKHFKHDALEKLIKEEFLSLGLASESTKHVVDSLIQTSLRGVDSHGINLFPHYVRAIKAGRILKNPQMEVHQEKPSVARVDANHAIGHHSGAFAMQKAMEFAGKTGIGAVSVYNSTHFGAAAYFGLLAAENNYIGLAFTNADALVKAHNATDPFFGTNPICFTAPLMNEDPLCLDMATSLVSWNKLKNYRTRDEEIPSHWAFDKEGKSVINPHDATQLSPIGDYKGFGLGLMVDVFCSLLSGGAISKDLLPMFTSPIEAKRGIGHFFIAINIKAFVDLEVFKERLQDMTDRIRSLGPLANQNVMVAGDPQKAFFKERFVSGIPIEEAHFNEYLAVNKNFKDALI